MQEMSEVYIGFRIPGDLGARVDELARHLNITRSSAARMLMSEGLILWDRRREGEKVGAAHE